MNKILFIDDDQDFGKVFSTLLRENEYEVEYASEAMVGLDLEKQNNYDLIIIDLYLEKFTGIQVAELIRSHNGKSRIMIMTNSIDDQDEVRALQLGIDEYLRKNTSFAVMLQRIKKVLETPTKNTEQIIILESKQEKIKVDIENHAVEKQDKIIHLTHLEFDLLVYLLKNRNVLVSRELILEKVWKLKQDEVFIDSRTVDVHIKNLRRKLNVSAIHSVRGLGYRWHEK